MSVDNVKSRCIFAEEITTNKNTNIMTTEFKVGQVFKTFGFDNIVTITKITQKGKIYYIGGNLNSSNENTMKEASISNKDANRYIKVGYWNVINK